MQSRYSKKVLIVEIIAVFLALLCLTPFYFLVTNSLKPAKELALDPASLPQTLYFGNYTKVFEILRFPNVFMNSLIVTVSVNIGLVIIGSMAAYRLSRHDSRFNRVIFLLLISAIVIPFQSIMIPMVKVASIVHWLNSYHGVMFVYFGFGISFTMFLFHGFIKTIPAEIEEAAVVDGCSQYGVFWKIVFPLLKPVTVTVLILNGLWIWNDFLLPLLIIPAEEFRTIPLAVSSFFGQYTKQWHLAMAALIMSITPVVIAFLSLQKYIIAGITSGAVKN